MHFRPHAPHISGVDSGFVPSQWTIQMWGRILGNEHAPAVWYGAFPRYVDVVKLEGSVRLNHTASNIRLLAYYEAQQALVDSVYSHEEAQRTKLSSLKAWWQNSSCVDKTYAGIKFGLVIQVSRLQKPVASVLAQVCY